MSSARIPVVRAVVFDFDGTLTKPGSLDFASLRKELGCPPNQPVLEFISALNAADRQRSQEMLDRFEYEAAEASRPNRGAEKLLIDLDSHRIPYGIVSRNSRRAVLRALENFDSISADRFKTLITRDDHIAPKPDPGSICKAAKQLGFPVEEILTVGDFIYDVEAGRRSGALTVYLANAISSPPLPEPPDYVVSDLEELGKLIARLRPLPVGKLPSHFLEESLAQLTKSDEQMLIGPSVGEDAAAIKLTSSDEVLVLKSDPITFTTNRLGYYAVVVGANDVATTGATARWLLSTLLLPEGVNAARAQQIITEVDEFCSRHSIQLCGGHTEITKVVTQPVVVAQLAGTVARSCLLKKSDLSTGDRILLTKAVAIEGTAIIAHEFPEELRRLGLSESDLLRAQQLLHDPGISILEEARAAARLDGVTAMHDVTEGGLATALEELSTAANCRFLIDRNKIRILPETSKICQLLGLDPLGLLGSGSLLIACSQTACGKVVTKLRTAGIPVEVLGYAEETGFGVDLYENQGFWPGFETDEISRALDILSSLRADTP